MLLPLQPFLRWGIGLRLLQDRFLEWGEQKFIHFKITQLSAAGKFLIVIFRIVYLNGSSGEFFRSLSGGEAPATTVRTTSQLDFTNFVITDVCFHSNTLRKPKE